MSALRRNACPTLGAPMATGDGLLARLRPSLGSFTPVEFAGLAEAAVQHGNGILEVTGRGSLQIRGLSEASALEFGRDVRRLGIVPREGLPVETGPLAGLDPAEIADPSELAAEIRRRAVPFAERLGPKVSVVVDGGGRMDMGRVLADIRLEAVLVETEVRWLLAIGGTADTAAPLGLFNQREAAAETVRLLQEIASRGRLARGRDLIERTTAAADRQEDASLKPRIGAYPLRCGVALAVALPFGQVGAVDLAILARTAGAQEIRLGLDHTLLLICQASALPVAQAAAGAAGLILDPADPRLRISACAGAPACHAGLLDTKALAKALAPTLAPGHGRVHLSGCPKRCAEPQAVVAATGTAEGVSINGAAPVATQGLLAAIERALVARAAQSAA